MGPNSAAQLMRLVDITTIGGYSENQFPLRHTHISAEKDVKTADILNDEIPKKELEMSVWVWAATQMVEMTGIEPATS